MSEVDELKPCPFCGSKDIDERGWLSGDGGAGPQCMNCGATAEPQWWNTRAESPDSVEEAGQSRSTDAPEATKGGKWSAIWIDAENKQPSIKFWAENQEQAERICDALSDSADALSTPQQEAPTQAEEQIGNALLSAKGLIEKLYSLVSHNPAMGRATSITINELDNAIDALFSLQPSKGVWVSRESAEVLAKFLPDDCYTNTPVGNAFKELKQSLERKNG